MATISSTLRMIDQFSRPIQRVTNQVNAAIASMERMRRLVEAPANLHIQVDASQVSRQMQQVRSAMTNSGSAAVIDLSINASDIMRKITEIQSRIRGGVAKSIVNIGFNRSQVLAETATMQAMIQQKLQGIQATVNLEAADVSGNLQRMRDRIQRVMSMVYVDVTINSSQIMRQVQELRERIQRELQQIRARIRIELPTSLTVVFANLQRMVLRFTAATRRFGSGFGNSQQLQFALQRIEELERRINELQRQLNNRLRQGGREAGGFGSKIKSVAVGAAAATAAIYATVRALKALTSEVDSYALTKARLGLITNAGQPLGGLQEQVFAAAKRSRGSYTIMADSVSKLGLLAGDAFGSNAEVVNFVELMQKSFKVGGASTMEQQSGMYQLTQAMAAGKLQGDEFRSIMENAPMLASAIAKFTGKSKGELKSMSAEGTITDDIIKGAVFSYADEINKMFDALPQTFGSVWTDLTTDATRAFGPIFERMNKRLNSDQGKAFTDTLSRGLYLAAAAAGWVVDAIGWIGDGLAYLWTTAQPVLAAIGGAFALWAITQIPALISGVAMLVTRLWLMVAPILESVAGWLIMNWPILLIGAAIGFLIYSLYKWEDATAEVIGYIGGIFGVLFAWFYNKFAFFANYVLSVAEFFINVWKDPVYAVKKLFYDLVINALEWIQNLATGTSKLLNKLGIKFDVSGVDNLLSKLEAARAGLTSDKDVVTLKRFEQMGYGDAFGKGQDIGQNLSHAASKGIKGAVDYLGDMFTMPKVPGLPGGDGSTTSVDSVGKVNEVGKINDTVDISSEDLKTMRELAEMKNIQNFVTLTPSFTFGDTHVRQEGRSVDEIIANIGDRLNEAIASGAQGVYA